jgi:hypothetical protein
MVWAEYRVFKIEQTGKSDFGETAPSRRKEAAHMHDQYHIFRQLPDGAPLWVETVSSLECAQERLARLAKTEDGNFAIFYARESRFVTRFPGSVTKDTALSK